MSKRFDNSTTPLWLRAFFYNFWFLAACAVFELSWFFFAQGWYVGCFALCVAYAITLWQWLGTITKWYLRKTAAVIVVIVTGGIGVMFVYEWLKRHKPYNGEEDT